VLEEGGREQLPGREFNLKQHSLRESGTACGANPNGEKGGTSAQDRSPGITKGGGSSRTFYYEEEGALKAVGTDAKNEPKAANSVARRLKGVREGGRENAYQKMEESVATRERRDKEGKKSEVVLAKKKLYLRCGRDGKTALGQNA